MQSLDCYGSVGMCMNESMGERECFWVSIYVRMKLFIKNI